jgi:hypothetical protein
MHISFEGRVGIWLALIGLAGAGCLEVLPERAAIGWTLIGVAGIGALCLVCYHIWELWNNAKLFKSKRKTIVLAGMIACSVGFASASAVYFWPEKAQQNATSEKAAPLPPVAVPVLDAQLREMMSLEAFLKGKDESALRDTFDLQNMLEFNILFNRQRIAPQSMSVEQIKKMKDYFRDGKGVISRVYATITVTDNKVANVSYPPGTIVYINTSAYYQSQREKLNAFIASPLLPSSVTKALEELNATLDKDIDIMFTTFNDQYRENPMIFVKRDSFSDPFYGRLEGYYWSAFQPLEPEAVEATRQIREYLGVH